MTPHYRSDSHPSAALLYVFIVITFILIPGQAGGDIIIGAKIAKMDLDIPSNKDPLNIAVNMGYEFDSLIADLSLIAELSRTGKSGEAVGGGELDFESESAYILWKTTRSVFVTLRGGVVKNKIITGDAYHRGDGVLLGASVGVVIGRSRLQIEYTSLAGDADFFGVGLEF
jgi:hypothetical protein